MTVEPCRRVSFPSDSQTKTVGTIAAEGSDRTLLGLRGFLPLYVHMSTTEQSAQVDPVRGSGSTCLNAIVLPWYEQAERFTGVLFDDSRVLPFQLHFQLACF